jgi:hypothetical protein
MQTTFSVHKGELMKGSDGKPLSLDLPFDLKPNDKEKKAIEKFAKDNGGDDWFSPKTGNSGGIWRQHRPRGVWQSLTNRIAKAWLRCACDIADRLQVAGGGSQDS